MTNNQDTIDSIILMLEEMLDGAWSIPLSGGKAAVDVDRFRELLDDLKMHIPMEVAKAKEIVNDRKIILDEAKKDAEMTVRVAEERAKKLVDHDEVVKQAQAKANEILSTSQLQARELKKATSDYVDSVLRSTEEQVAKSLSELRSKRQAIKAAKIN
ncbi:MAG TPA: ATPase [Candidatus Merdivicinus intestinigallinarum]|nr:ATPase [Candidatus Merdivicinus intestinigallinarum]